MRISLLTFIVFCLSKNVCCQQHPIITQFKDFVANADMTYYIEEAQRRITDNCWFKCKHNKVDTLVYFSGLELNLYKERLVPMLNVKFVNTEVYNYEDNIYDFMSVDSIQPFSFACVDKKMKVTKLVDPYDMLSWYQLKDRKDSKLKKIIKQIYTRQHDLILYCNILYGFHDLNGFMYIEENRIYLCRANENDVYELNDYIRSFFSIDRIRCLGQ